jgi:hypothetical protein
MTTQDDGAEDSGVGYGQPPRSTRFTKGRSGNPAGRVSRIEKAFEV